MSENEVMLADLLCYLQSYPDSYKKLAHTIGPLHIIVLCSNATDIYFTKDTFQFLLKSRHDMQLADCYEVIKFVTSVKQIAGLNPIAVYTTPKWNLKPWNIQDQMSFRMRCISRGGGLVTMFSGENKRWGME